MSWRNQLDWGGAELSRIHRKRNFRKAETYWIGFLRGVLASEKVEHLELPALRAEAEGFLRQFNDADANDLIQDLDIDYENHKMEIFNIVQCIVDERSKNLSIESDKDTVNHFYGYCGGIACDNWITPREVESLLFEIEMQKELIADKRISSLQRIARKAISDRKLDQKEGQEICDWISRLVGDSCADTGLSTLENMPVAEGCLSDPSKIVFKESIFVVTGAFALAPRKVLISCISGRGGIVRKTVTRKTDYLVIAGRPSRDWIHTHAGTKIVNARQLRELHEKPNLVDEYVFSHALGDSL